MKKIIFILSLISVFLTQYVFVNHAQAQSIELIGNNYVSGNPAMPIASYIIVKNITSNSLDVKKILLILPQELKIIFVGGPHAGLLQFMFHLILLE
jgi:hypothetical protein